MNTLAMDTQLLTTPQCVTNQKSSLNDTDLFTVTQGTNLRSRDILVNNEIFAMFSTIVDEWLCLVIALFGVVNNALCITVFCVQGFKDTVNITMTNIAFWDIVKLTCAVVIRFYGPMSLVDMALGKTWLNITFTNIGYIQGMAGNISYVMAGYVAVERSLCVSIPFDVRRILTTKITKIICAAIPLVVIGSLAPVLWIFEIVWIQSEEYGTIVAEYRYSSFYVAHGRQFMEYYKMMAFFYPMISLFTLIVSTCVIAVQLKRASRFRQKAVPAVPGVPAKDSGSMKVKVANHSMATSRDRKVVKLLLVVILAYISVLLPRFVHFLVSLIEPEYYVLRLYQNIFWCVVYSLYAVDYTNASSLLFIYLAMSSNFKETFLALFEPKCP